MSQTNRLSADFAHYSSALNRLSGVEVMHASFYSHRFAPHLHDAWSIGAVVSGIQDNAADAHSNVIQEGQLVVTRPYRPHAGRALGTTPCQYVMLYVSDARLRQQAHALGLDDINLPANAIPDRPIAQRLIAFVFDLLNCERSGSPADASLNEECGAILDEILLRHGNHANSDDDLYAHRYERRLYNSLQHLQSHWNESVSLDELARRAALSPAHFCRRFSQMYGLPPHRYQLVLRIVNAKRMLHDGEEIGRVALQAGFSDHSHFGRQFKSCFGFSPGQLTRKVADS
ncbi:AraC family transcriptional regulator [Paraburkholderia sp. J7]|uniref:AraC family transcriptional regulator n=1 Tax=Paraburkholderia sp. J7 TaxID=2805438 RepID=UPI002AB646FF|nr:AraC family transcriptional regulator [Paraburkholderia sp. J7]